MTISRLYRPLAVGVVIFLVSTDTIHAASEYATFESFYKASSVIGFTDIGFTDWVIAGSIAIAVAGAVIVIGVAAAPATVVAAGTWVGNMMGLTGAVATKAGLALLGGGSIASGGFGMAGGAALLTAVFTFSTDMAINYAVRSVDEFMTHYSYAKLAERSENMATLPMPPVNQSGPESYENAVKVLSGINVDEHLFSSSNRGIINKAIRTGRAGENYALVGNEERARQQALLSLLYFVSNEYIDAKKHAAEAMYHARTSQITHTLPMFIFATSSLYEENVQFESITGDYFTAAILNEPDNPLIPLLFAIYLDRLSLRFNDTSLNESAFANILMIMQNPALENDQPVNYLTILSRYFIQLKLHQQKITYLANASNPTIKNSPITLKFVKDTLQRYEDFLNGSRAVMKEIVFLGSGLDDDIKPQIKEFYSLLEKYADDRIRLTSLVNGLEAYQMPSNR